MAERDTGGMNHEMPGREEEEAIDAILPGKSEAGGGKEFRNLLKEC